MFSSGGLSYKEHTTLYFICDGKNFIRTVFFLVSIYINSDILTQEVITPVSIIIGLFDYV